MSMDPNLKERWLEALRSGRYEQTLAALRHTERRGPTGYCCLGVLADVIDPDGWQCYSPAQIAPSCGTWKGAVDFLVDRSGGCERTLVRGLTMKSQRKLADINDESTTFGPAIAWIEANL